MWRRRRVGLAAAGVLLLASLVLGALSGPAPIGAGELWRALSEGGGGLAGRILLSVRLPRVAAAAVTGGGLAVSGVLFQALLRNPLAEPYLLGVSAGAAFGAVLAISLGLSGERAAVLPLAALAGAVLAIAVVLRIGRVSERLDTRVLLLAGVVAGAFFSACVMLLLTFARPASVRPALLWTMGSFGDASWRRGILAAVYILPASLLAFSLSRHLDALSLGEDTAAFLGTEVERLKLWIYLLASLMAAVAVSVGGVIGFVGLVVPHAVRMLWGAEHRYLLPTSFLGGGALLVAADAIARTAASPMEIPVGVVTALVGVPFFLLLLRRSYA